MQVKLCSGSVGTVKNEIFLFDYMPDFFFFFFSNFSLTVAFLVPQLCQAKGFVCEFCGNDKDIIFPFQLNKCQRCEGEQLAGLGGLRAPSPRPSNPLSWRDWKIPKPRRLATVLSQDRIEGEGGEENVELGREVESEEEGGEMAEANQGGAGMINTTIPKRIAKAFSMDKEHSKEQEVSGETDSEKEEDANCDEEGEEEGNVKHGKEKSKRSAMTWHTRRGRGNLLKALHIDRLKKNVSKGDRRDSESTESQDETGQEKKHLWKIPRLPGFTRGLSKEQRDGGTEEEERVLEEVTRTQQEDRTRIEMEDDDEISDSSQPGETDRASAGKEEKFKLAKVLKAHQLPSVFIRGKSKGEEDRGGGSDEKREKAPEEEKPQSNWRARKTRKARRLTRGKKIREDAEREREAEGGASGEVEDEDSERGGGGQE